jgi:hypothetical protein
MAALSDEDIQKIAEAVAKNDSHAFYVDPKDHYNSHERLDKLLDSYDSASNIILKFFIGLILLGVISAAAVGAGWHK